MDTNEPRGHDDPGADQNAQDVQGARRDQPTTPLPWWQEGHGGEQEHPTAPLPWLEGQQPATAPGMAVTDSMKAGEPLSRPSFLRRHALGIGVAAAVVAAVVVAGGTAWGVAAAVAGGDTAVPAAMNSAMHAKKGAPSTGARAKGAVGTVTAISGGTWTMQSAAGATITVKIGSSTIYGTAKKPTDASSFAVGDRVGVLGARSGDTVTATRIVHLAAAKHAGAGARSGPTGTPTATT